MCEQQKIVQLLPGSFVGWLAKDQLAHQPNELLCLMGLVIAPSIGQTAVLHYAQKTNSCSDT